MTALCDAREFDALERLRASGAVAIMRLRDHRRSVEIGHALADAGLAVMEVTLDDPAALAALRALADALPAHVMVGAGTVRRPEQVAQAAEAGARFCLSPHCDPAIVEATLDAGLEPVPGAGSATEVARALDAGARIVKLFPAGPLGIAFMQALLGPFRGVDFLPTGGIRHDGVTDWLDAGAAAVGLGSDLVPALPEAADLEAIAARARVVAEQVARARRPRA
jgi:2-dehydro-3-deoxyphosphogluconate aldolase / (4S)-4-hydroxy-2-oxoglutarate aldolase